MIFKIVLSALNARTVILLACAYRRLQEPALSLLQKHAAIILTGIILIAAVSCNPEEWETVDCSECFAERPSTAKINIKLTINNINPTVTINVYRGRIEEEVLEYSQTVRSETWSMDLPADQYYTVTATYRSHNQKLSNVTAIDGNFVRTRRVRSVCDGPCWIVQGNSFNVRLRY
jgi:hypothetical protein